MSIFFFQLASSYVLLEEEIACGFIPLTPLQKNKLKKIPGGVAQVVQYLLCKYKTLSSNPSSVLVV
jgi:hypothetical protein